MKNKQRRIELKEYRLRRSRKHRLLMKLLSLIEPSCLKPHLDKSLRFLDETLVGKNKNPKTFHRHFLLKVILTILWMYLFH